MRHAAIVGALAQRATSPTGRVGLIGSAISRHYAGPAWRAPDRTDTLMRTADFSGLSQQVRRSADDIRAPGGTATGSIKRIGGRATPGTELRDGGRLACAESGAEALQPGALARPGRGPASRIAVQGDRLALDSPSLLGPAARAPDQVGGASSSSHSARDEMQLGSGKTEDAAGAPHATRAGGSGRPGLRNRRQLAVRGAAGTRRGDERQTRGEASAEHHRAEVPPDTRSATRWRTGRAAVRGVRGTRVGVGPPELGEPAFVAQMARQPGSGGRLLTRDPGATADGCRLRHGAPPSRVDSSRRIRQEARGCSVPGLTSAGYQCPALHQGATRRRRSWVR
jgi:hypothetical protein